MLRSMHFASIAFLALSSFSSAGCVVHRREPPREVRREERREDKREDKHEEKREERHEERR